MRPVDFTEKRRSKRLELFFPTKLKCVLSDGKEEISDGITANVSYSGAYIRDFDTKGIKPYDNLHISMSVSRDDARDFPFSRLIGKAKVIRVERDGVALEFDKNINRLSIAN